MRNSILAISVWTAMPLWGQLQSIDLGTSEDLSGIWMDEQGSFGVIVGNNGVIFHYDGADWNSVSSPTTQNLYDVHGLAADDVVASGQDVILHWDGVLWSIVVSFPSTAYTPVLMTADRIWYGIPDSQFPIIGRCDRMGQGCLGLVSPAGSVLDMQEDDTGEIVFIGTDGDIVRSDASLSFTFIHDQPLGSPMGFSAADVNLSTAPESWQGSTVKAGEMEFLGANENGLQAFQITDYGSVCPFPPSPVHLPLVIRDGSTAGIDGAGGGFFFFNCEETAVPDGVADMSQTFVFLPNALETLQRFIGDEGSFNQRGICSVFWQLFGESTVIDYTMVVNDCVVAN